MKLKIREHGNGIAKTKAEEATMFAVKSATASPAT